MPHPQRRRLVAAPPASSWSSDTSDGRRDRAAAQTFCTMRKIQVESRASPRKYGQAAVDLEEHFLGQIIDARPVGDHPVDQAVDEVLVLIDELAERCVVA